MVGATALGLYAGLMSTSGFAADIKRGGTITVARSDEALSLDPFAVSDNGSIYNIAQICEPLILADAGGTGLEPGVAESWTAAPDGLSIDLKIRAGIKFSNGNPVGADDVIFSLRKVSDPKGSFGFAFDPIKSIDKVDEHTVRLTFKQPYAALQSALSLFAASIVSKADYEKDPAAFGTKPVCTGPFQVKSYERGTEVVLTPNPHYWRMGADGKPLPYVDEAILKYVPESNSRILGLQNGDFDVALAVPLNQAASVKAMDGVSLEVSPSFRLDYVFLNQAKKPLDDKRIRLALNYAANRDAIMKAVYFGYGEIPNSYMPKVSFWSDKVAKIPFDIEKAKQLIKDAGYDGTPIQLMVDTGNASFRTIATILQQGWKQAGLNVEIVEFDVGVRRQGFWDNRLRELTEALVHQVCHIRLLHLDEVDVGRGEIVEALVVAAVVVVLDERRDLLLEITRQEVVFEQDAVLQRLVPSLDLALGLGMAGRTARMFHTLAG